MSHKSIPDALEFVAKHSEPSSDSALEMPVWELVSRELFLIANSFNSKDRGSLNRATIAQGMLMDRMVGRRRPGTHPAQSKDTGIDFVDLTIGVIDKSNVPPEDDGEETVL